MLRSVWKRLASFRRPDGPTPGEPPEIGDPVPERPRMGVGEPRVLLFLRHVGCAFGERMLADLRAAAREFPEVQFIAIAHGEPEAATAWCEELGFTRVHVENAGRAETADEWCRDPEAENLRVFVDEDRELYAEWGLGLGGWRHLLGARNITKRAKLWLRGVRDREPSGTRWQRAGMFAVDPDGTVRARHVADYAGDLPDPEVGATFLDTEPIETAAEAPFSRITPDAAGLAAVEPEATALRAGDGAAPEPRTTARETEPAITPAVPAPRDLEPGKPAIVPLDAPEQVAGAAAGDGERTEEDRQRVRLDND